MFSEKVVFNVDYNEIEDLIDAHFMNSNHINGGFRLAADQESGNDTSVDIYVEKQELGEYELGTMAKIQAGKWPSFSLSLLLTELCNRDIIPSGSYLIRISW